jgi:glycosyltransferase involved in cell wall biosynthesis
MTSPLISIIIPTYNAGETLRQCLESIVVQDYERFEVLIMDGLSTDETINIVNSYSKKFPSIKCFSQNDDGIYDAMNKGVMMAEGEWVYFLGSDDTLYSDRTLTEVVLQFGEEEVIYGDVYSSRFNGRYDGEFDVKKIREKNICHQSIFFKKKLF